MMQRFKKFSIGALVALVAFTSLAGVFFAPQPAQAFPVTILENLPEKLETILTQIWEFLKTAVLNAAVRLVSYAIRKVAYDSAVWLASGGKGQTPFAHTKGFGGYLEDVGNEAFGAAIESLSDPRSGIGINLCKIPDIKVDLAMKVGLRLPGFSGFGGGQASQKPSCSFTEFTKNWGNSDAWRSRFSGVGNSIEQQFNSAMSSADQTDFGIYLGAKNYLDTTVLTKMAGEQFQRLEGQGYQAKSTLVSNQITTPAGVMKKELEHNTPSTQQDKDEQQIAALLSSGDIKVLPTILGIFINTLASTMVKNYQEKGIFPFGLGLSGNSGPAGAYESSGVLGGRRQAQEYFSSILQTAQIRAVEDYDLAGQLSSCPDTPATYNCRADGDLIQALKQTESNEPITIGEALKQGSLHGQWKLIPPSRVADNMDKNCYTKAYCYGDVKVLRQTRILPLGFEIAAKLSNPDRPWTLEQVVKGFNDCNYIKDGQGRVLGVRYDPVNNPFCHLIDPNWVLKLPAAKCRAAVWGATPVSGDTPYRSEQCADLTSCVGYDSRGHCNNYAYCTREKNVWAFGADACDAQYRTCRTYQSATGQSASYLYRTLNTGFCAANNVGCNFYSLKQNQAGAWQDPGLSANGENTGIYFNNQVSDSCSANSAGCSAFSYASSTNVTLYLRQAPEFLGCYDSDLAAPGTQWPENQSELNKLPAKASCQPYAQACVKDEVGCNLFTPLAGDNRPVPGKYAAENVCAPQCVGYDSYREMPSNYSDGQAVSYIIPSSGAACNSREAGCTGFTNVSAVSAGGAEQVEYFSYLRPCVLPSVTTGTNFFTYEGSLTGGFELKTYRLSANIAPEDLDPANPNNEMGAPKYFYRLPADKASFASECNQTVYTRPGANLDCRQFNDSAGKVYYRLLSKTIPVSAACAPYRLNDTELSAAAPGINNENVCVKDYQGHWDSVKQECQLCFQNGEYRDGQCFYNGLPGNSGNSAGVSLACNQSADSCREYKGNAGNNIKVVLDNTFEDTSTTVAQANWTISQGAFGVSSESTRVGGHSLGYTGAGALSKGLALSPGESYDLTFWAKGTGVTVAVSLGSADNKLQKDFGTVSLGDTWNLYHLGPIELNDPNNPLTTSSFRLSWTLASRGSIYLDNVRLVQVAEDLYLIKNSLRVDPACDSVPEDNLPGEALGCKAYKDSAGAIANLTSFSFLCREKAIGCTPVYDTRNTDSETGPHIYNVWLAGGSGSVAELDLGLQNQNPKCQIPVGQAGCYVNAPAGYNAQTIIAGGGRLVTSTVYIPADTAKNAPLYLVANQAATCHQIDLGCAYAGKMQSGPLGNTYITTTIKNDPSAYRDQLCSAEAVGCSAYTDSSGGNTYFKDPIVSGQKICSYRPEVTDASGDKHSGWFWNGVGVCAEDAKKLCVAGSDCAAPKVCAKNANKACLNNNDCGVSDICVESCQRIGEQACYPKFLEDGSFGLWSSGDVGRYDNFVGLCPAAQNQCTEFVDHNDNDRSHSLIKNDKISAGDCSGLVSQKNGCALFDQTDNPNKYWSTKDSYDNSNANDGKLVAPVANLGKNDANILIKVKPDRVCGEWLQCRTSHVVKDQKGNSITRCDDIGRCNKTLESSAPGDLTACANWVVEKTAYANQQLSEQLYAERPINWTEMDFSGWSLLNVFPLEELKQINISASDQPPLWRLAKPLVCRGQAQNCPDNAPAGNFICNDSDQKCGPGGRGWCLKNKLCVQDVAGSYYKSVAESLRQQICRAYPEETSPFPNLSFSAPNANFCNETLAPTNDISAAYACECSYSKVHYGDSIVKYWSYSKPNTIQPLQKVRSVIFGQSLTEESASNPDGICLGGSRDKRACNDNADCFSLDSKSRPIKDNNTGQPVVDGVCQKKTKEANLLGWPGYCVEEDFSRSLNEDLLKHPCLSWLPVDQLSGAVDIDNYHPEAGYQGEGNQCIRGNLFKQPAAYWRNLGNPADFNNLNCVTAGDDDDVTCGNNSCHWEQKSCPVGYARIIGGCGDLVGIEPNGVRGENQNILTPEGQKQCTRQGSSKANCVFYCVPNNSYAVYVDPNTKQQNKLRCDAGEGSLAEQRAALFGQENNLDPVSLTSYNNNIKGILRLAKTCVAAYAAPLQNVNYGSGVIVGPGGGWASKIGSYLAGCEEAVSVSAKNSDVIAWTNRVWSGSRYPINAAPLLPKYSPEYTNSLLYLYGTPNSPFGKTDNVNAIDPAKNILLLLLSPWCRTYANESYSLPSVNNLTPQGFSCDLKNHNDEELQLNDSQNQTINYGRPYNVLDIRFNSPTDIDKDSRLGTAQEGKTLLTQLFAKVKGGFKWVLNTANPAMPSAGYVSDPANPKSDPADPDLQWDVTATDDDIIKAAFPPAILSVGQCKIVEQCLEGKPGAFTINNKDSGEVVADSSAIVRLSFYAFADKDHLPIKNVRVDWQDGLALDSSGLYRNRRGYSPAICNQQTNKCSVQEILNLQCAENKDCENLGDIGGGGTCNPVNKLCERPGDTETVCKESADCLFQPQCVEENKAPNFGLIAGQTCDNNYFLFTHSYICTSDSPNYSADKCGDKPELFPNGCCTYRPKITITDNWGWCNGACQQGGGCYGNECKDNDPQSGLPFGGQIIVAPAN